MLLAVHWTRVDDVLAQSGALSGKVVLTCSLPMSKDDSHIVIGHSTSGAEALAAKLPRAHVVSAFSTVPSEALFAVFEKRGKGTPPDLIYCADDQGAKNKAARLIREVGFNPMDLGPLSTARYIEPFSLLVAQLAYHGSDGPGLAYHFERLPNPTGYVSFSESAKLNLGCHTGVKSTAYDTSLIVSSRPSS